MARDAGEHTASGDSAAGEIVDTEAHPAAAGDLGVGDAVVGAVNRMLDVRERVPLRRRLWIKVVEVVVEHELGGRENLDGVLMFAAGEQRRIGNIDREIQREDFAALDTGGRCDYAVGGLEIDG